MSAHAKTRAYWVTWAALVALTVLSWAASTLPLGAAEMPIALAIATVKASLIALFFMHLVERTFSYRLAFIVGALFLVIMVGLTIADLQTRGAATLVPPVTAAPAQAPAVQGTQR